MTDAGMYPAPAGPGPNMYPPPALVNPGAAMYPPPAGPVPNMGTYIPAGSGAYPGLNAPTPNMPPSLPGYEGLGSGGFIPPPVPLQPVAPQPSPDPQNWSIPSLTEDDARAAFKEFVTNKCCYGSGPAETGVITKMEPCNTYRYCLETFTESRSTEWAQKPHKGEVADFYTQPAPRPWEVPAAPKKLFEDEKKEMQVPFTSTVKDCSDCQTKGKVSCKKCDGSGKKECSSCDGTGKQGEENCSPCNGSGKTKCSPCQGSGKTKCDPCDGSGRVLSYINLKVEWSSHKDVYLAEENLGLKLEHLDSVEGKELFKNDSVMVYPVYGFPHQGVSEASDRLVKEHQAKYSQNGRILQQRQKVDLIPVTKVDYQWESKPHTFIVYGTERAVQADDYPETCLCCVIL